MSLDRLAGWKLAPLWLLTVVVGCSAPADVPAPNKPSSSGKPSRLQPPLDEGAAANDKQPVATKPGKEPELFAGWPKPEVALVITGNQHGYLEPCGCTGLANQKGGLARRHSLIQELQKKGWDVVPLDAGNQVRRFGQQAELQFQMTADALKKMGYRAIGLGDEDLQLSELLASIASDEEHPGPFLSANMAVAGREHLPRHLIVEAGGRKIGVTAVVGDELRKKIGGDVLQESVDEGLAAVLPKFDEAKCNYRVLLAFASEEEAAEIAKRHKVFDLVVASSGPTEPTPEPEKIEGVKSQLVHTGVKGMYVVVIGLYDDAKHPLRYERVPLDARYPDSKDMRELMAGYQEQLKQAGLAGLGLKPQLHPKGKFVGAAACGACHTQAMKVWEKSKHAQATESLIHPRERGDIPRHYDPECLSCHVTGWDPQKYVPFEGGYLDHEKTPKLMHNGCENCHGPGSKHVDAETGNVEVNEETLNSLRTAMRLPLAGKVAERKCMECHDIDNSPDFHAKGAFEKYWKEIDHKGKD